MRMEFRYGSGTQSLCIPDENLLDVLHANPLTHKQCGTDAVKHALSNPIGCPELSTLVKPGQKIAIMISDITRPFPAKVVLPCVLQALFEAHVSPEDITVVFALGSHRHHTEAEKIFLVGKDCYNTVRCIDSDPGDCVNLGTTSRGTPVEITRIVAEADFRICLGNIEFHYFAGYSGGAKALMPGVASQRAIQANHRWMVESRACAGILEENPLRQDIEEAGRICRIDYIVNVVLDEQKNIVLAVAGDVVKAHRVGCRYVSAMYGRPIAQRADIVIVSAGGAPKDGSLYQAQKALENAKYAVRNGGTIILISECSEGFGSKAFAQWMLQASTPQAMVERIRREFQLGGHKAAAIGMMLSYTSVILVSKMDEQDVAKCFMHPAPTAQAALQQALVHHGANATILAIPCGGSVLPMPKDLYSNS